MCETCELLMPFGFGGNRICWGFKPRPIVFFHTEEVVVFFVFVHWEILLFGSIFQGNPNQPSRSFANPYPWIFLLDSDLQMCTEHDSFYQETLLISGG